MPLSGNILPQDLKLIALQVLASLNVSGNTYFNNEIVVSVDDPEFVPLTLQSAVSHSNKFIKMVNASGIAKASVSPEGRFDLDSIRFPSVSTGGVNGYSIYRDFYNGLVLTDGGSAGMSINSNGIYVLAGNDNSIYFGVAASGYTSAKAYFRFSNNFFISYNSNFSPIVVKSDPSITQVGNLTEWQTPLGAVMSAIRANGRLYFDSSDTPPVNTATPSAWLDVTIGEAVYKLPLYQ